MAKSTFKTTLDSLMRSWPGVSSSVPEEIQPHLPGDERRRVERLMQDCIESRGGEVSARSRAADLGRLYLRLDAKGKKRFLQILARKFALDRRQLLERLDAYREKPSQLGEQRLREALVSPRMKLLQQFNALPRGTKFLIDLRSDLLPFTGKRNTFAGLDNELKSLLATWFDIGFLELRRITWESPAALLEKLIAYEAVHQIESWEDLRNRLESDRRCYAFFHPAMPDEPLIFIEVALVNGIAGNIQTLLDPKAPEIPPETADTAIFYSISNAQKGLKGISFGNFLIKQVVDDLSRDLPNLKTFATLSPIPGLSPWLTEHLEAGGEKALPPRSDDVVRGAARHLGVEAKLSAVLAHPDWPQMNALRELLREPMERLCALYLHQRRSDGAPIDPVERFHLGNGARIEAINWLGDTSPKGLRQSFGMMVNYLYHLKDIEKNHEAYAAEKRIAASRNVRHLLRDQDSGEDLLSRVSRMFGGR